MNTKRRTFLGAAAAVGLTGAGWSVYQRQASALPRASVTPVDRKAYNVLFILTDQERSWDQLPHDFIDRHCPHRAWLRQQSLDIRRANTTSQLCSMARSTIYTGCHSPHTGVWENTPLPYAEGLRRDVPTMGSVFQDGGYLTGYAGKWHLTHMLNADQGANAQDVQSLVRTFGFDEALLDGEADGAYAGMNMDEAIARRAADFMRRHQEGARPWLLAVNLVNPHDVMYYTANDEMTQSRVTQFPDESARPPQTPLYQEDLGYAVFGTWGPATRSGKPRAVQEFSRTMDEALGHMPYDDETIAREFQNYYLNCIRDCDRQLGVVLQGLRDSGQWDNTIVVFTSDHGEFLGAHGLRGKGSSIYREASEVPLLIAHPDGPKGQVSEALFSAADLIPTMLGMVGLDTRAYLSQLPLLAGHDLSGLVARPFEATARDRDGVLAYWTGLTFLNHENVRRFDDIQKRPPGIRQLAMLNMMRESLKQQRGAMRGLVTREFKFARYFRPIEHNTPESWEALVAANDIELYDLRTDPKEVHNLAENPAHRETVMRMNAQLNRVIRREIGADDGRFLPIYMRA
jgi:arylsulfatase A-like enzyme